MKVNIGPYKNWFGPYQLAEKLLFWVPQQRDKYGFRSPADKVHNFGEFLAHGSVEPKLKGLGAKRDLLRERDTTLLYKFLLWVDSKRKRKVSIRIDEWDTWSMDYTLAEIILPMLKQLRDTKHGSPMVDLGDVPPELRFGELDEWDSQLSFDFYKTDDKLDVDVHARWLWVINEMIWAFETHLDEDSEDQFYEGDLDFEFEVSEVDEEDNPKSYVLNHGSAHTRKTDIAGLKKHLERKSNGFRLFGKYYESLWD